MTSTRRFGPEQSETRTLLLDTTEKLMVEEGYAAVSTRRVAKNAGLTPGLVHYYFKATDDLLVALYRRTTERNLERLSEVLNSDQPLHALWQLSSESMRTSLVLEFMALANHRKVIATEIARYAEYARGLQAEAVGRALNQSSLDVTSFPPSGVTVLIAAVARSLIMEENVGIHSGHAEARAIIEALLQRFESERSPSATPGPAR